MSVSLTKYQIQIRKYKTFLPYTILVSRTMIISQACSFVIISQIPDKKLTQHYSQQKQHSNDRVNYFYK